jgi:hypothetical protein
MGNLAVKGDWRLTGHTSTGAHHRHTHEKRRRNLKKDSTRRVEGGKRKEDKGRAGLSGKRNRW